MTGSGTLLDPYIIWDVDDLQDINLDLTAYYELGQDIEAAATLGWNGGLGFLPIGDFPLDDFTGHLDGKFKTVNHLWIVRPLENEIGLFSTPNGAVIQNVSLLDCYITGKLGVGALVSSMPAHTYATTLVNKCFSSGFVSGRTNVGGLVGTLRREGAPSQFGIVRNSLSLCRVEGRDAAPMGMPVGGLVGKSMGLIIDSYSRGVITGSNLVGGLLGWNEVWTTDIGTVINSYATGSVTGPGSLGGLIGSISPGAICTDSFWDIDTSGRATSFGGTGLTTAQMKLVAGFITAGWDFGTIWGMIASCNDGYPCLLNVNPSCAWAALAVTTNPATNREAIKGTLNGKLDSDGGLACDCGFEWGEKEDALVHSTPTERKVTGELFSQALTGLTPGKKYYFRAKATA